MSHQNLIKESHQHAPEYGVSARRAVLLFVLFWLFQIATEILLSFALGVYGGIQVSQGSMNSTEMQNFLTKYNFPIAMLSSIASAIIIFLKTKSTLHGSIGHGGFASLGWKKAPFSHTLIGLLVGIFLAAGIVFLVVPTFPPLHGQEFGMNGTAAASGGWQRFYWAMTALLVAPLIEEFLFRGILFTGISSAYGTYASAAVVSLLFVVVHIPEAIYHWPILIGISLLSIATIISRIKTESLFPAVAVHFGYNLFLVISVYEGLSH